VSRSWEDFIDFEDLPEVVNPPEGYIVSANHKLVADDAPIDVGQDWVAPYRAARIEELISATPSATPADCARWQLDDLNGRARLLLPTLLAAIPVSHPAHAVLSTWDMRDAPEAVAPLVFARLVQGLGDEWLDPLLGAELAAQVPDHTQQLDNLILTPSARAAVGITEPLAATVSRVLTTVDLATRYDTVHHIADHHPLGRGGRALRSLFCPPPTPVGGSRHTVCLMAPNREGAVIEGAPWRLVAELAPDGARLGDILRHGSSGHPLSRHYDDQTRQSGLLGIRLPQRWAGPASPGKR
jgi:penicillin amidase